jgi:hypothetical protein
MKATLDDDLHLQLETTTRLSAEEARRQDRHREGLLTHETKCWAA